MPEFAMLDLSEQDYLQMEEALSQTARGRAFLRMRDRRSRVVAIDEFHRLAGALERQVDRLRGVEPEAQARVASADGLPQLHQELTAITQAMRETRNDVAALKPADTGANRIDAATGELDEIVAATERATTDILNATEKIQEITQAIPRDDETLAELADAIEAWCIEIMTACSFQDITGQRTTKVVNTLRYIEQRVNTMIEIWGVDRVATPGEIAGAGIAGAGIAGAGIAGDAAVSHRKLGDTRPDAHLLNGPQLSGQGVSQDQIDALFDTMASAMPHLMERAEPAAEPEPEPERPAPIPLAAKRSAKPPEPEPADAGCGGAAISQSDIDKLFA